ncbi:MAG: class I adenylate-forming enzyme family protein [SAR324 cluster bacterium]
MTAAALARRPSERCGCMNIVGDFLRKSALRFPDKLALVDGETRLTYAELHAAANRVTAGMRALGLQPGERVSYHGNNRWELVVTLFAAIQGGFILVPLNVMLRPAELDYILGEAGIRLILTTAEGEATARQLQEKFGYRLSSYDDPDGLFARWFAQGDAGEIQAHRAADEALALFFTSGTTGLPKGAPIDHEFVSHLAHSWVIACRYTPAEVFLVTTPMFWTVAPIHCIIPLVLAGGTIVLMNRFDLDRCCDLVLQHRVTSFFAVPTMYTLLVDRKADALSRMKSLRVCSVAGAPISAEIVEKFESLSGAPLLNIYGATEAGALSREMLDAPRKPGCAGTLGGTVEVKLVDGAGNRVPPGTPGEILARGFTAIKGYWQQGHVNPASLPDGWFHTGDIGVLEDGAFLRILDRAKDMIITGGANIYPAEVERVIASHPGVQMSAVIGIPDRVMGELPVAYVVPRQPGAATPEALNEYCRQQLSSYKVPRRFMIVASLPMTPTGKIQKVELRKLAAQPT